jgi:hypothetical protein
MLKYFSVIMFPLISTGIYQVAWLFDQAQELYHSVYWHEKQLFSVSCGIRTVPLRHVKFTVHRLLVIKLQYFNKSSTFDNNACLRF